MAQRPFVFSRAPWAALLCALLLLALPVRLGAQTLPAGGGPGAAGGVAPPAVAPIGATAQLEGQPILRVDIVGNTRTPAQVILDQIRSQPGQVFSRALLSSDLNAIAALDRFVTVRAEFQVLEDETKAPPRPIRGVIVRFVVEERSLVTAVEIAGNRSFTTEAIREGLAVRAGIAVDQFRIETDRRFIVEMYQKKGYAQASVDVDMDLVNKQGIVRYQIIEGPASHISQVIIEGNTALTSSYIKFRLQTKSYIWIFRKGILEEASIQQDLSAIREMYLKKGYLDVRVSVSLEFTEDKSKLTVRFIVLEGQRYKVGTITVKGNAVFSQQELLGDLSRFGPGAYAEHDKMEVLTKRIQDAYGHQGYIYSVVELNLTFADTPGVVNMEFKVTEDKPYTVGRIIIRGNGNIQDKVIRRQVRIYPDQTFDMVLVRKSVDRIKATHLTQDVKATPINEEGNPPGVKSLLIETAEGQTGRFSLGAGLSTGSGLVGQFSLEQQNFDILNFPKSLDEFIRGQSFKGAGQYFRLLLEPGTQFQRYRITFQEPYLFDTPYSFANDLYYFTRARESWNERRIGDIVTFGRRFGDVWSAALAFRAEQVTLSGTQDLFGDGVTQSNFPVIGPDGGISRQSDTAQEILNERGSHFLTSIKPSIYRDTTDSASFPTTGSRASFAIEQYGTLGGDVDITKFTLSYNWYHTLYTDLFDRKTVLSLRNEVGLIPFGDSPTYERFYLGGIGDLRGFRYRGVGPHSGPLNDPIGGDFSWNSTAEVNFPIYEEMLRGVVFVDMGTVERDITIGSVRSDFGAGVRVNLPFFGGLPIALDVAYPLTKKNGDRTQIFSISLGVPF